MNKKVWIIGIAILLVVIVTWIYFNRRIEEAIDEQGVEIMEDLNPEEIVNDSVVLVY